MVVSLFLAKLIGIYFLVVAALMVLRKNQFEVAVKDFVASTGLLTLAGFLNILAGLAIAIGHNVWESSWRVIITILGYLSIIKGLSRVAFPAHEQKFVQFCMQDVGYWIIFVVLVVLGIVLTYFGFATV